MSYYRRSNPKLVIWLGFLSILVVVLWMYYSKIQQVVRAEGKVVPAGQNKVVQHLEGGIIAEILVNEGDIVSQGQVLFRIKNEFVKADLAELAISKQALEAKSYRLKSLLSGHQKLSLPKTINISKTLLEGEKRLFSDALNDFTKELQVLTNIYQRKQNKVFELVSQRKNLQKEFELAKKELGFNEQLFSKGAVSERDVLDSQRRLQIILTNYDKVDLSIPTARSEEHEALSKLEKSKSNFQLKNREKLNKVLLDVEKINKKIQVRQDVQQRSEVVSSVKGVVNKLLINTIGGIIQSGEALASITPLDDSLIIEAKVKEIDRGEIWLGQKVKVKLSAYDFSQFGGLDGRISFISPDSAPDRSLLDQYVYRVNVVVNEQKLADNKPILPGMVADVDILGGNRRVLAILMGPILKSWSRALREQ